LQVIQFACFFQALGRKQLEGTEQQSLLYIGINK